MPADPVRTHADTIGELHNEGQERIGAHQRGVESLTAWLGKPLTLYLILIFLVAWIGANLFLPAPWDEAPFPILSGLISAAALLLTTVVLITQNRQSADAERRAHLELHINLVAEQRTAKLIGLLEELRRDLPIADRHDEEAEALQKPTDPREAMAAISDKIGQAK